jgi:SAM-dependent methyltransferase
VTTRRPISSSGWQDLVKSQVRRRYDYLSSEDDFPPGGLARAVAAGYDPAKLASLPAAITAAFSGSCNPLAGLDLGGVHTAIDLGCGAGLDTLLLATTLPDQSQLIAVDFSSRMLDRLKHASIGMANAPLPVIADIERLPIPSAIANLVVANASLNLAVDPDAAFCEIFRVLSPGGRLAAGDFIRIGPLPADAAANPMAWNASIGGVMEEEEIRAKLQKTGFDDIEITGHRPATPVISVRISARKPS